MKLPVYTFTVLSFLCDSISSLKCWTTLFGEVVGMMDPNAKISSQECFFPNDKSCMKHWYTVTYGGPVYVELGCSNLEPAGEVITTKGTGEDGLYYCGSDWCNISYILSPSSVLLLSLLSSHLYFYTST